MGTRAEAQKLEHQIELANRVVRLVSDDLTIERLRGFSRELQSRLQDLHAAELEEETRDRAHKLWQEAGRPEGRDLEFWLQAERQLRTGIPSIVPLSERWDRSSTEEEHATG